jgi:hypothetical protein
VNKIALVIMTASNILGNYFLFSVTSIMGITTPIPSKEYIAEPIIVSHVDGLIS